MELAAAHFLPFFDRDVWTVAQALIGSRMYVSGVGGIIVETEAYGNDDAASHSFGGPTERCSAMFGSPGTSYLYRSYGIHWCYNVVCRPGTAVLIRAIEPEKQLDTMRKRRGTDNVKLLCSGPGRICQALQLDGSLNGKAIWDVPFEFHLGKDIVEIANGVRIGISKATETPWRYGLAGSKFLSRRF